MSFSKFGAAAQKSLRLRPTNIAHELGRRAATTIASPAVGNSKMKILMGLLGGAACGTAGLIYSLEQGVKAFGMQVEAFPMPWTHNGIVGQLDTASIRRGWQVYKQVCMACHHMITLKYFHMINVCMTEAECRAEAADALVQDGPDSQGNWYLRPGRLYDFVPDAYPNDNAAAAANNGAVPAEMSLIVYAKKAFGHEDYIYNLLMGYPDEEEIPAGVKLGPGQAYNPYFTDGIIGMARQLYNDGVNYDDGTEASASQQAKDVSTFLRWVADRHFDWRKQMCVQMMFFNLILFPSIYWIARQSVRDLKTMKVAWRVVPGREPHKNAYYPVKNVFEQEPAKFEDRLSQHSPNPPAKTYAASRHLYKSHAPRYQFKNKYPGHAKIREWSWKYNWDGHRLGMYFNDQWPKEHGDPVIKEAVFRLPPWERDARQRRIFRAMTLAAAREHLPRQEWTRWEEETWYLLPYIDQVEAEMVQRSLNNIPGRPNWFYRHRRNKVWGIGKAGYEATYWERASKG